MALRPSGFRRENGIVGLLVGLSVVGYILTGNELYMTISATFSGSRCSSLPAERLMSKRTESFSDGAGQLSS